MFILTGLFWIFAATAVGCLGLAIYCQFFEGGDKSALGAMMFVVLAGLAGVGAAAFKGLEWMIRNIKF